MEQLAGSESNGLVRLSLIARQKCEFLIDKAFCWLFHGKQILQVGTLLLILSYPETSQVSTIKLLFIDLLIILCGLHISKK